MKIRVLFAFLSLLGFAAVAPAQVALDDFSNASPTFLGDWTGQQGAGVYAFTGNNSDESGAEFVGTWNLTGYDALAFTGQVDTALTDAASFAITLLNDNGENATSTFLVSSFNAASLTTVQAALTASGGFDFANVTSWRISGGEFLGAATLSLTADQITAVSAVPEPATYAALAGLAMLGVVVWRRRTSAAASSIVL
jgi:hypothetical protein